MEIATRPRFPPKLSNQTPMTVKASEGAKGAWCSRATNRGNYVEVSEHLEEPRLAANLSTFHIIGILYYTLDVLSTLS